MRWALLAVFVTSAVALAWLELQLDPGILAFELAGTPARSQAILDSWGPHGQRLGLISLAVDTPFLVAYGLGLAILTRWRYERFVALPLLAAGLDALENACLAVVLLSGPAPLFTGAGAVFAAIKFGLLLRLAVGLLLRR